MDKRFDNPERSAKWRIVVDECVSPESVLLEKLRQHLGLDGSAKVHFLSALHRGIPDRAILRNVLSSDTILATSDRVLHNQALALGFRSFTLDENGRLVEKPLTQFPTPKPRLDGYREELKSDYVHPANEIASALKIGMSERSLKRERTRRRRIRSYFGSEAAIAAVSVTIGDRLAHGRVICGYFIAVAGNSGVKGIRGSEGYGAGPSAGDPSYSLLHALKELYLLQLETVRTELYIIPPASLTLCQDLISGKVPVDPPDSVRALARLLGGLKSLTVHPCNKGRFFERMQSKLASLARNGSNEIVPLDFPRLIQSVLHGPRNTT